MPFLDFKMVKYIIKLISIFIFYCQIIHIIETARVISELDFNHLMKSLKIDPIWNELLSIQSFMKPSVYFYICFKGIFTYKNYFFIEIY
jgi:hypothetical protein